MAPTATRRARTAASVPPAKRPRHSPRQERVKEAGIPKATLDMWSAIHQFTLVGGADYDTKENRLEQTLARLPPGGGAIVIFADATAVSAVKAIVERHQQLPTEEKLASMSQKVETASNESTRASSAHSEDSNSDDANDIEWRGSAPVRVLLSSRTAEASDLSDCQYIINYDFPATAHKYLDRVSKLRSSPVDFRVVFTFVTEADLESRRCRETMTLIRKAKRAAETSACPAGAGKAVEFQSALQQLNPQEEEEEEEEEGGNLDDSCDCKHCQNCKIASRTYHARDPQGSPRVEAVHVHIGALENMTLAAPRIASRLEGHVCTVICLHCLYCHTPWDGDERLFALPDGLGAVRVIFPLAEEGSWHAYPDSGTLSGGVPWADMLDMPSMDKTDRLLERLVDHEIELLNGQSERVILMGVSQGGCQAMLRFLRSRQPLGGFVGGVTHAPTMPHTPHDSDPLLGAWRPLVNLHRPIRFLAGGADTVMPPAMVLRDAERLRAVGGFLDVEVDVMEGLAHEDYLPEKGPGRKKPPKNLTALERADQALLTRAPDLHYLRSHLPSMLGLAAGPLPARGQRKSKV